MDMEDDPSSSVSVHPTVDPNSSNNQADGPAAAVAAAKAAATKAKRMKSLLNRNKKSVHSHQFIEYDPL